jgi:putative ABC transport system ATP-binding protein
MSNSLSSTTTAKHGNGSDYQIDMRGVVKTFKTAAGPFTALKSVNLRVNKGEFVAVIGKSGSGKSTLLNMLTGIDRPTAGEVYVGDTAVHQLGEGRLAKWRGKQMGIVFQFFQLLPTLTLVENVMLPMDLCGMYSVRERKKRALGLLDLVEMGDQANKRPRPYRAGSSSASPLPAPWRTIRPSSSPTNRPAISTRRPPSPSSICSRCWEPAAKRS